MRNDRALGNGKSDKKKPNNNKTFVAVGDPFPALKVCIKTQRSKLIRKRTVPRIQTNKASSVNFTPLYKFNYSVCII